MWTEPNLEAGAGKRTLDVEALERALRAAIRGTVRFDAGYRAIYATDGSNYRMPPIGVVLPMSVDEVVRTVEICRSFGAPILSRGGGTSLAGQTCNTAVVIDWSRFLHNVLEVDTRRRLARVQPGTILDHLRSATAPWNITFGPDPATHDHCTLGGMIGNDSCGVHAQMAGRVADNVSRLEVLTYDGLRMWVGPTSDEEYRAIVAAGGRRAEIYKGMKQLADRYGDLVRKRFPKIPRRVSGYNLDELLPEKGFNVARALVGSEGTLVTILEAELKLVPFPPCRNLVVLGYPDIYTAGDHIIEIAAHKPIGLEGLDDRLINFVRKKGELTQDVEGLPPGGGFLLVEFGGETMEEADAHARMLMEALRRVPNPPRMELVHGAAADRIWAVREAGLGVTAHVPGMRDTWEGWEDSAVPPEKLGVYLRKLRALFDKYGYGCSLYGHFGQGCVHTRIDFDLETTGGIRQFRRFVEEAADLVVSLGGSLSGEHGDGQSRAELLPKMFGEELVRAFEQFKGIWDPENRMNPGKIVFPNKLDQDLRLGAGFRERSWNPETHFSFRAERGSFLDASLQCVGVGKCRRTEGGTMCPSYMVTREEEHSTRGRARALFEMLQGEVTPKSWHNDAVKESLELCLSCKGCKSDCPVNVDMATYKAEFLSHYWEGRLRPIRSYALGWIHRWARLASLAPELANFATQVEPFATLGKALIGVERRRKVPRFAPLTFQAWWRSRPVVNEGAERVMLWPDTFSNHFHPEIAMAAVESLEGLGYRVLVPEGRVCCGRPLYDYGMLDTAKALLQQAMAVLSDAIAEGLPVLVLEPSCAAVFRDELGNLYPDDPKARTLANQTFTFAEFVQKESGRKLPQLGGKAVLHGHCHEKAVLDFAATGKLLGRMGVEAEIPDSGCCGMAGSFGYEKEKYEVSVACGERVLLPRIRHATATELVIADGFSCRSQIEDLTEREALHTAQVMRMAQGGELPRLPRGAIWRRRAGSALLLAGLVGAGALAARWLRKART